MQMNDDNIDDDLSDPWMEWLVALCLLVGLLAMCID